MAESIPNGQQGRKRIYQAVIFLLAVAFLVAAYWFFFMRGRVFSDDARIDAELVDLAPQISGVLTNLYAKEGGQIRKGDILFELDTTLLEASVSKAEADVVSARASLDVAKAQLDKAINGPLKDEIRIARAEAQKSESSLHLAELSWERADGLFKRNALSASERDKALTAVKTARNTSEESLNRLLLLEKGTRREDVAAAESSFKSKKAELEAAEVRLKQAKINLGYATVRSPFAGVVVRKWRDPGATLAAGTPVLTLLDPSTLHVSANIDEKYLYRVGIGDRVDISVDAFPRLKLSGRLEEILRATNSQFSLIPAEGTSGTFIKVAQRVPLRISIEKTDPSLPLGPGLSVEVKIFSHSAGKSR